MKNFMSYVDEKIVPKVVGFTQKRFMTILMNSFMSITALTIAGSIFTIIKSLPLGAGYTAFLTNTMIGSTSLLDVLSFPVHVTSDFIAVYLVFAIGYFTAKSFDKTAISGGLIALGSFLLLQNFSAPFMNEAGEFVGMVQNVIPMGPLGAQGIFLAILVGMLAGYTYVFLLNKNIKLKMPETVPANVQSMFEAMLPAGIVFLLFLIIRCGVDAAGFMGHHTVQQLIFGLLQKPLMSVGGGLAGAIVFYLVSHILWMFGVHGAMVAIVGMYPIYSAALFGNAAAFAAGAPIPSPEWSFAPWTLMGGSGNVLALAVLMVFVGKSAQLKSLGKLALPAAVFNIGEPIIFGLPIMLNPFFAIPFILTPLVNLGVVYTLMVVLKVMPMSTGAPLNNFMPFGIYGALANGHWTGLALSIGLLALDIAIYFPFFKMYDKQKLKEENATLVQQTEGK